MKEKNAETTYEKNGVNFVRRNCSSFWRLIVFYLNPEVISVTFLKTRKTNDLIKSCGGSKNTGRLYLLKIPVAMETAS